MFTAIWHAPELYICGIC